MQAGGQGDPAIKTLSDRRPQFGAFVIDPRLKQALALVDARLLEHFVVSAEGSTSMAARGWV